MRGIPAVVGSAAAALILAGCMGGGTGGGTVSTSPTAHASPNATNGYRLYVADGSAQTLRLIDARSGAVVRELPRGTPAPDWSHLYTVSFVPTGAVVSSIDTRTGTVVGRWGIPAGFTLPAANFRGDLGGLSPHGQWLVLQRQAGGHSDFLVVNTAMNAAPQRVSLAGDFTFDAINDGATNLYLIQSLGANDPGHYLVRLYDLSKNTLFPYVVVDKREAGSAAMSGRRIAGVFSPDGSWQFSLYDSPTSGAFIHALNLNSPFAWCIDLPGPKVNHAAQRQWGLAVSSDGTALFAANPILGLAAKSTISGNPMDLSRSSSFPPGSSANLLPFGTATLSGDGHILYASAGWGLVAIDTATLTFRSTELSGTRLSTLVSSPDGAWLYASSPDGPSVLAVDASSGRWTRAFTTGSPLTLYGVEAG